MTSTTNPTFTLINLGTIGTKNLTALYAVQVDGTTVGTVEARRVRGQNMWTARNLMVRSYGSGQAPAIARSNDRTTAILEAIAANWEA